MGVFLVGMSHATASLPLREKLFVGGDPARALPPLLCDGENIREIAVVSTCNRIEIYAEATSAQPIIDALASRLECPPSYAVRYLYQHEGDSAVRYLFRVASGLESQILGETQILGQLLETLTRARLQGTMGRRLSVIFESALAAGKRVQAETDIGSGGFSVGRVAVEKALSHINNLENKSALIVGAGQTSELIARHLLARGKVPIFVANRTHESAVELAEKLGGKAVFFSEIENVMNNADVVISSTRAPHLVIYRDAVERAMEHRKGRPLVFIDVAVPRDIDPSVVEIPGVSLCNIDELRVVTDEQEERRRLQVPRVEQILNQEFEKWEHRHAGMNIGPVIAALHSHFEQTRVSELEKISGVLKTFSSEQREAVEQMTRTWIGKILHLPVTQMKQMVKAGKDPVDVVCELFSLQVSVDVKEKV